MSGKLYQIIISLSIFALTSISCKDESPEEIIKIGQYVSLTGSESTFGISSNNGLKLAVEEINGKGGVLGKQIRLITADNRGHNNETITVVEKLITGDEVVAVIGEVASSRSIAGAPVCEKYKVPMITPASTNPEVTAIGEYIFRVCFIDNFQATVMSKFALNSLKVNRVAILADLKNAYSSGLADNFERVFTEMGGEITTVQKYSAGDKDFTTQLKEIKDSNPDAIFIPGYYTEVNMIAIQARDLDLTIPLIGGDGWESPKLLDGKAKDALEGCFFSGHVSLEDPNPKVQSFITKYRDTYGMEPDAPAMLSFDAGMILFDAIQRAGSTNNEAIRNALAETSGFDGLTGMITINEQRNAVKPAVVIMIQDGKFIYKETIAP